MIYLSPEQILFLHARVIAETGGAQGIRDIGLLISALDRLNAAFGGSEIYPDVFTKAAALLHSLIQNHPFVDGNERTGIAAAVLYIQANGFRLTATNTALESFTMSVARGEQEVQGITTWFIEHSQPIEAGENND